MALDFSALDEKTIPDVSTGKPAEIPLADIEEDPAQPRIEFSDDAMKELTESIRERGVKSPISVRPHPEKIGKWILNYGARRYRSSLAADKITIPAFIDENHDDYDQVIENLQRENLTPRELALFIKKRVDAGDKKSLIAKRLCKDSATITFHLALIDLPQCIDEIYNTGKCMSVLTLYELRKLYDKNPVDVEKWCESDIEITRHNVAALAKELNSKRLAMQTDNPETFYHDKNSIQDGGEFNANADLIKTNENQQDKTTDEFYHDKNNDNQDKDQKRKEPKKKEVPLLLIEFEGQSAEVLLNKRPSQDGFLFISCTDGREIEVEAGLCKIDKLLFSPA